MSETDLIGRLLEAAIEQGKEDIVHQLLAARATDAADEARRAFSAALVQFQAECPPIRKDSRGAHGATYADLDAIMARIGPALRGAGLAVSFDSEPAPDGDRLRLWCIVTHEAGHSERHAFDVAREQASNRMNASQRDGSASSYGRRYALGLALGITTGERDDDGAGASRGVEPVTTEQAVNLQALVEETGADLAALFKWVGCDGYETFPANRYEAVVRRLEAKRGAS